MRLGLTLAVGTGIPGCRDAPPVDTAQVAFTDFSKRLDEYVELRRHLADSVTPLEEAASQAAIATRADALGRAIVAGRKGARQGDIFTTEAAAFIATLIREEYRRRPAAVQETRDDQQDEVPDFVPKVNQIYPTTYPLATFPASLLPLLPPLPEPLEYRTVGHYLIIRDTEANLIVDVMPDAVP